MYTLKGLYYYLLLGHYSIRGNPEPGKWLYFIELLERKKAIWRPRIYGTVGFYNFL